MKKVIGICLVLFLLIGFSACTQQAAKKADKPAAAAETAAADLPKYGSAEAKDHVGEEALVCGTIISTEKLKDYGIEVMAFDISNREIGSFSIAIKDEDRDKFPEKLYVGEEICAKGEISATPFGTYTIETTEPSQFLDKDGNPFGAPVLDLPMYHSTEAGEHVGEEAYVCGNVQSTEKLSDFGIEVMTFDAPPRTMGAFAIAIADENRDKFPAKLYKGMDVCVKGLIEDNPYGSIVINDVTDPSFFYTKEGKPLVVVDEGPPPLPKITYDEGVLYVWTTVKTCGKIIDQKDDMGATILGMGESVYSPGAFDVMIAAENIDKLPGDLYMGQEVCIEGRIIGHPDGSAGVRLTDPAQVTAK